MQWQQACLIAFAEPQPIFYKDSESRGQRQAVFTDGYGKRRREGGERLGWGFGRAGLELAREYVFLTTFYVCSRRGIWVRVQEDKVRMGRGFGGCP